MISPALVWMNLPLSVLALRVAVPVKISVPTDVGNLKVMFRLSPVKVPETVPPEEDKYRSTAQPSSKRVWIPSPYADPEKEFPLLEMVMLSVLPLLKEHCERLPT